MVKTTAGLSAVCLAKGMDDVMVVGSAKEMDDVKAESLVYQMDEMTV